MGYDAFCQRVKVCVCREELAVLAQQRQQWLEAGSATGRWRPSEDYDFDVDDYEEYEEDGGYSVAGRKASRPCVAVTPGKRPVNRHKGLGSGPGQSQIAGHGRRKRG